MATQIKLRRTTNVENKTLSQGEPLYDIPNNLLYVGSSEGSTPGSAINKLTTEEVSDEVVKFTIGGNQTFEKEIIPKQVQFAIDGISYDEVNNFHRVFRGTLGENSTIECTPYNENTHTSTPSFAPGAFIFLILEGEPGAYVSINSTGGYSQLKFIDDVYPLSREGNTLPPFFLEYNKWYQFIYRTIESNSYFDLVEMSGAPEWNTWEDPS